MIIILFMTSLSCGSQADLFNDATTKIDGVSPLIVSHNLPITGSSRDSFYVTLRFSEELDPDSINTNSVMIKDNSGSKLNNISISYDSSDNEINITGVTDSIYLIRGSVYTVTLTKDIADIAGNNLEEEFTGSLSVATSPHIPGNGSIWTSNYNNGYFAGPGDSIYIIFNENITTSLSSAQIVSRTVFTPSLPFTGLTATISGNQLVYTYSGVSANTTTSCSISLSANDFSSAADGTACQAQNVSFNVVINAVTN